ncbi:MAG TPA: alginate export family protein [Verrucomicrobiota bacterium]|nr:alginate export family protein [Verrucomicrobiota bacterium]
MGNVAGDGGTRQPRPRSIWLLLILGALAAVAAEAQNPPPTDTPAETTALTRAWAFVEKGTLSASARYRFEVFDRDEPAFPDTAEASTFRLAVGYETPPVLGISGFAEYEGVFALGSASYNVPGVPEQTKPGYPSILDPEGHELNQAWLRWRHKGTNLHASLTVGRQEFMLNDGRFVSLAPWRQNHQTFDAVRADLGLPHGFSLTYLFADRARRVVGEDAADGTPPMDSHWFDAHWRLKNRVDVGVYGVMLDYESPPQYGLSTKTFGVRCTGPWRIDANWDIHYVTEFAQQQDFGQNPDRINANYWLGELGVVYRGHRLNGGIAWLGGRSATDKLSTPLAHPFNGWTELFASNPSSGTSHGLQATYVSATGTAWSKAPLIYSATFYDYRSVSDHRHYGNEVDLGLVWKVKPVYERWEIGCRCACYWADTLFCDALRASVYTAVSF